MRTLVDWLADGIRTRSATTGEQIQLPRWISHATSAGEQVSGDNAMRLVAVWASVDLVAGTVASLPLVTVHRDSPAERLADSRLVQRPSASVPRTAFVRQLMTSLLLRGNGWALVTGRDDRGYARSMEALHPDRIRVRVEGPQITEVRHDGVAVPLDDVVHMPMYPVAGSPLGLSPIAYAAEQLGLALATERYGSKWFDGGGHPSAILHTEKDVDQQTAQSIKDRFTAALRGGGPAVLGQGLDYKQIQVQPEEAQFLETQRFAAAQICRLFGVQPEMLGYAESGSSVTYANRQERALDWLTYQLSPRLAPIEDAFTALRPSREKVRFDDKQLLRSTPKQRFEAHQIALGGPWMTRDEGRDAEHLPPAPDDGAREADGDGDDVEGQQRRVDMAATLIRSGFKPHASLEAVGLDPIDHFGLLPVTLQSDDDGADGEDES